MRKKFKTTDAEIVKMWNDDFEMTIIITPKEEPVQPPEPPAPQLPNTPTGLVLKLIVTLPTPPTNIKAKRYA